MKHPTRLLTTLREKVAPDHTILMVVDTQNDFVAPGGFADQCGFDIRMAQAAVRRIGPVVAAARRARVPILFTQHSGDLKYQSDVQLEHDLRRGIKAERCHEGTWGSLWWLVNPQEGDVIIKKHRYDAFFGTPLDSVLRASERRTIVFAGLYTDGCVAATARGAFYRDYYCVVLADCTASLDRRTHALAVKYVHSDVGVAASSDEIIRAWSGSSSGDLLATPKTGA